MRETQESDWTPAAYAAREERRRRSAIIPGSDWTLQAFATRELARSRRARLERPIAASTPTPSPIPARDGARHLQPVLQSDWTLPAIQAREAQRQSFEAVVGARDDDELRRSGPLQTSDWTLSAFRARELERARQEAREAAARTPVLQATMRPFLRAAATQAAARPISPPPRPPRPPRTPDAFRSVQHAAAALVELEPGVVPADQPARPTALDPETTTPSPKVTQDLRAMRGADVERGAPRDNPTRLRRRLAYGLGAFALLGLGIFLLRPPAAKAPAPTPAVARNAQPTKRPPPVQEQAQKRVAPRIEPATSAPPAPRAANPAVQAPAAPKPVQPGVRETPEVAPAPAPAPRSASERSADQGPSASSPRTPAAVRSEMKSAPASVVAPPKQKAARPTARPPAARARPLNDATPSDNSTPTAPSPPKPEAETDGQRPDTWFERLTAPVRAVGQSERP